jgi:ubiquinone/menaquinone biosynthesis C-methylase UbiE
MIMNLNFKYKIKKTYDSFAERFDFKTKTFSLEYLASDLDVFLEKLKGRNILDIGSGPGRDSIYFKNQGYNPTCVDISEKMIEICREKGLDAQMMDMESMNFNNKSFDGVWAFCSLLHLPKENIKFMLKKIYDLLTDNGVFFMGMKKGDYDGFRSSEKISFSKRYFAYYQKKELEDLLKPKYNIIAYSELEVNSRVFLNFMGKKKV